MNVRISFRGLFSTVTGSAEELNRIQNTLRSWARQFEPRRGGGPVAAQGPDAGTLHVLTGVLLAACGYDRKMPDVEVGALGTLLRDYQLEAVQAAMQAPYWRSIIKAPGGSGKTHIAAGIISCGASIGLGSWLYLVTNKELASQTARVFDRVMPEMLEQLGAPDVEVICTSYGTLPPLAARGVRGVLVDECHGIAARTRMRALAQAENAVFRCGLSATPLKRQDIFNSTVVGLLGPVVYQVDPERLIAAGHLAKGNYHLVCL